MLCRLCLRDCNAAISLEQLKYDEESSWKELIQKYLLPKLDQNYLKITIICELCSRSLKDFHIFFLYIEQCQLLLLNQLGNFNSRNYSGPVDIVISSETCNTEIIIEDGRNSIENYEIVNEAQNDQSELNVAGDAVNSVQTDIVQENDQTGRSDIKMDIFEEEIVRETFELSSNEILSSEKSSRKSNGSDEVIEVQEFGGNDKNEHKCDICGKTFKSLESLLNHMPKSHKQPFVCKFCGRSMRYNRDLQRHIKQAHRKVMSKEENHSCALCRVILKTARSLSMHMKRKHESLRSPYKCQKCGREFTTKLSYDRHLLNYEGSKAKPNDLDDVEYRTCGGCGKIFGSVNSLKGHFHRYHYGVKPFECEKCHTKFGLKQTLERHKVENCQTEVAKDVAVSNDAINLNNKNVSDKERNACLICHKKFRTAFTLSTHVQTKHTGAKSYQCQNCGLRFIAKFLYDRHLRNPDNSECSKANDLDIVENLTCGACRKIYVNVRCLQKHFYRYHHLKPFECEKCHKKFDLKQKLDRHKLTDCRTEISKDVAISNHATISSNENIDIKRRHTCLICHEKFDQFSNYNLHLSRDHIILKPFKCEICGSGYKKKNTLRKHVRKAHANE